MNLHSRMECGGILVLVAALLALGTAQEAKFSGFLGELKAGGCHRRLPLLLLLLLPLLLQSLLAVVPSELLSQWKSS